MSKKARFDDTKKKVKPTECIKIDDDDEDVDDNAFVETYCTAPTIGCIKMDDNDENVDDNASVVTYYTAPTTQTSQRDASSSDETYVTAPNTQSLVVEKDVKEDDVNFLHDGPLSEKALFDDTKRKVKPTECINIDNDDEDIADNVFVETYCTALSTQTGQRDASSSDKTYVSAPNTQGLVVEEDVKEDDVDSTQNSQKEVSSSNQFSCTRNLENYLKQNDFDTDFMEECLIPSSPVLKSKHLKGNKNTKKNGKMLSFNKENEPTATLSHGTTGNPPSQVSACKKNMADFRSKTKSKGHAISDKSPQNNQTSCQTCTSDLSLVKNKTGKATTASNKGQTTKR